MSSRRRIRDQHGLVLPTRLMVFSISTVALAGLVFVATPGGDGDDLASPASSRPTATATSTPDAGPSPDGPPASSLTQAPEITVKPSPTARPKPPVRRGDVLVVAFNNSNIKGLAGRTAARAEGVGWGIAGTDNWFGTVDTSTVYYGPELKDAAALLGKDLNIASLKPAVDPMRSDRLTVILTADYRQ
jgi:hypothetical protein